VGAQNTWVGKILRFLTEVTVYLGNGMLMVAMEC